jgi:hypothetical protein
MAWKLAAGGMTARLASTTGRRASRRLPALLPRVDSKKFPCTLLGGDPTQSASLSAASAAVSIASGDPEAVCMPGMHGTHLYRARA